MNFSENFNALRKTQRNLHTNLILIIDVKNSEVAEDEEKESRND